ncbi:MAG: sigma-54 dependent transcriptional regulator [Mucinivorans sp.]
MSKILVVDDQRSICNAIKELLEMEGHAVKVAENGMQALESIEADKPDLVISDIKMEKMDGLELLEKIKAKTPEVLVMMMSGHGTIDTAVESIKNGALDFVEKPIEMNRFLISVRNALSHSELKIENKALRRKVALVSGYEIIGHSPAIEAVKKIITKVAPTDARVLVLGQSGTGKELVARQLHMLSSRATAPFIEVNCAAIPSELIESELFGHEKGSFTSAIKQRRGKFEQAEGGTIFMDEIGDMSLAAQAKVLRALQEKKIARVGADSDININVRVIAATNKNLAAEINEGKFREDLYHRLSVINIRVPPLADRREDIPILVDHFLKQICDELSIGLLTFQPEAIQELVERQYDGNVRELRNLVERIVILNDGTLITPADIKQCV